MIRKSRDFGTIEPGKRADILILGKNPLENILNSRSIEMVIVAGEVFDREATLAKYQNVNTFPRAQCSP